MDEGLEAVRDAAYVVVGLGVLAFQRAQVQRRALTRQLAGMEDHLPPGVRDGLGLARDTAAAVRAAVRAAAAARPR